MKNNGIIFTIALLLLLTPAARAENRIEPQINLNEYNVFVLSDERVLVMMAALTVAGYDSEGDYTGLRKRMREDLQSTDPNLVERMRTFYNSHRRAVREEIAQASPYIGLALSLAPAPDFNTPTLAEKLPPDVRDVYDFVGLLREFYKRSAIRELLPKYASELARLKSEYERAAAAVLFETLSYLHTEPTLYLPPTPIFLPDEDGLPADKKDKKDEKNKKEKDDKSDKSDKSDKEKAEALKRLSQPRMRRLLIFINPFAAPGSVFQRNDILNGSEPDVPRRIGDEYSITASEQSLADYIRYGFLRFVLDPIVGKSSVDIANLREKIAPLIEALPKAKESARRNVYEVVGESLARAAGLRITALSSKDSFTKDDAVYALSQYYEQGAVLSFHFYEGLQDLERVGIDVREFVEPYLKKIDFERESKRLQEAQPARARVEQKRAALRAAVKSIVDLDELIKQRKFDQAEAQLQAILKEQPRNARALFAMAQIVNSRPSAVELDEKSDEGDKIAAQEERLARAVKLYRDAIASAGAEEQWLVSQCHVLIGRILDFVDRRDAAIAEYEMAIKVGDIPKGAYKEALEGKAKPYAPSNGKKD